MTPSESAQFLHAGERFPPLGDALSCSDGDGIPVSAPYLGAETAFVLANGVPNTNGVIALDQIVEPTVIGHLVGGIASTGPYPVNGVTCASSAVYEVRLVPGQATNIRKLDLP